MLALLLSVKLVSCSLAMATLPPVPPPGEGGPVNAGVVAASTGGAFVGDVLVLGLGYGALQLFASGALEPTADGFRHAAYAVGAAGLLLPPLLGALGARWAHGRGPFWRAALYAVVGQALALAAGWAAWPRAWAFLPAQAAGVGFGAALGLRASPSRLAARRAAAEPVDPPVLRARPPLVTPVCPDG
jgi:hypothetical protein